VLNTLSPVTVTQLIAGLPTGGLTAPITFTGIVACASQPRHTWSITIPAGSTTATAAPIMVYDHDTCSVTEDTAPAPPTGYTWDTSIISPVSFITAPGSSPAVTLKNHLTANPPNVNASASTNVSAPAASNPTKSLPFTGVDGWFELALGGTGVTVVLLGFFLTLARKRRNDRAGISHS